MDQSAADSRGHRLIQLGVLLFLIGLATGFLMPLFANTRMGLSSHLEGVFNGMLLMILGLVWPRLVLSAGLAALTFWLALYGSFANWLATLLAAFWGAGSVMMPLSAQGMQGNEMQEIVIMFLLLSLSAAMILVSLLVLWGLRSAKSASA